MNTTIASLRTTVADQATTIASIQTTSSDFCGALTINTDLELALMAQSIRSCGTIGGTLTIQSAVSNGTLLAEAFQGLRVVYRGFGIISDHMPCVAQPCTAPSRCTLAVCGVL